MPALILRGEFEAGYDGPSLQKHFAGTLERFAIQLRSPWIRRARMVNEPRGAASVAGLHLAILKDVRIEVIFPEELQSDRPFCEDLRNVVVSDVRLEQVWRDAGHVHGRVKGIATFQLEIGGKAELEKDVKEPVPTEAGEGAPIAVRGCDSLTESQWAGATAGQSTEATRPTRDPLTGAFWSSAARLTAIRGETTGQGLVADTALGCIPTLYAIYFAALLLSRIPDIWHLVLLIGLSFAWVAVALAVIAGTAWVLRLVLGASGFGVMLRSRTGSFLRAFWLWVLVIGISRGSTIVAVTSLGLLAAFGWPLVARGVPRQR